MRAADNSFLSLLTHFPRTFLRTDLHHHMTLQVHYLHLTTEDLTKTVIWQVRGVLWWMTDGTEIQWRTEGEGGSNPPQDSEDIGGVLDRMSKKNRRLDFLLQFTVFSYGCNLLNKGFF